MVGSTTKSGRETGGEEWGGKPMTTRDRRPLENHDGVLGPQWPRVFTHGDGEMCVFSPGLGIWLGAHMQRVSMWLQGREIYLVE